jgi:beta-glucosidase
MTNFDQLVSEMSLDEKISLLAGKDLWHTVPIPRLNIPSIKVTDGPNGVRGAWRDNGPPSICLPVGMALGATWNVDLVARLGALLAKEVKRKGAHILLAPTVNIHRTPIAGRNFECFAEDPYLSGKIASAYINGLQGNGVGACIKHFACNDQEFERRSISAEVATRPLREIYLEPFRIAMKNAQPWAVMSAYNKVNGTFASENDLLLKNVLKDEWGFDGLVMSDWFGTYTPDVPAGGLDLEMPGPGRWMSEEHVKEALANGRLTMARLDDKVRRILRIAERAGAFAQPEILPEQGADRPEERQLIRAAAQETIVLLKNEGVLPLKKNELKSIAVIGELARWPNIMGGGSSQVRPHYIISPLAGIREHVGQDATVKFAPGCFIHKTLPAPDWDSLTTTDGQSGLKLEIYDNLDFSGEPAHRNYPSGQV